MKKWLKRIRGAVGMGLTWAAAWAGVFTIYWGIPYVVGGTLSFGVVMGLFSLAVLMAGVGFAGGAIFSTVLGVIEGRRSFDEMSLPRFAALGAVGGLLVMLVMALVFGDPVGGLLGLASVATLMGAGSAAGSLALARRAAPLLESGESDGLIEGEYAAADSAPEISADVADIGLTEEEKRKLLLGN